MRALCYQRTLPDGRWRDRSFPYSPGDLWLPRSQDWCCRRDDQSLADAAAKPYLLDYHRYPRTGVPPNPAKFLSRKTVGPRSRASVRPAPTRNLSFVIRFGQLSVMSDQRRHLVPSIPRRFRQQNGDYDDKEPSNISVPFPERVSSPDYPAGGVGDRHRDR